MAAGCVLATGIFVHRSNQQKALQAKHPSHEATSDQSLSPSGPEDRTRVARNQPQKPALTPDAARLELEDAKRITDIHRRASACRKIISSLCESGHPDEAWTLIETNAGMVRDNEIFAFFRSARLTSEELSARMGQLLYQDECFGALGGYFSSLSLGEMTSLVTRDPKALESLPGMHPLGLKNTVAGDLMNKLSAADAGKNDPFKVVGAAVDFHRSGLITDYGLASILKIDPTRDAFQKYQALSAAVENTAPGIEAAEVRKNFIRDMIYEDAVRGMEAVLSSRGTKGLNDLASAVERYESIEPVRAEKWFSENQSKFSPAQKDTAAMAFFNASVVDEKQAKALTWMNQIQDPQMKQKAEESLAERFKKETVAPK